MQYRPKFDRLGTVDEEEIENVQNNEEPEIYEEFRKFKKLTTDINYSSEEEGEGEGDE